PDEDRLGDVPGVEDAFARDPRSFRPHEHQPEIGIALSETTERRQDRGDISAPGSFADEEEEWGGTPTDRPPGRSHHFGVGRRGAECTVGSRVDDALPILRPPVDPRDVPRRRLRGDQDTIGPPRRGPIPPAEPPADKPREVVGPDFLEGIEEDQYGTPM